VSLNLSGGGQIGLYADAGSVHLAEMRSQFGSIQIVRTASEEAPPGPDGSEPAPDALAQALRRAWERGGFASRDAHLSLPEGDSMVRTFEMPLLPRREWRTAVRFEAQKYLPFDVRDLYVDFKVEPDRARKRMRVTFLAVKRHTLETAQTLVTKAGLKLASAEPESLSLMRLLFPQEPKKTGRIFALLDVDSRGGVDIVVSRDSGILMTRHFRIDPSAAGETRFPSFMGEVRLSFNYFSKNFKDEKIERMVLCADVEKDHPGWNGLLAAELEMPVEVFNPAKTFGRPQRYSSPAAGAMGAALKAVSSNRGLRFDLLPSGGVRPGGAPAALSPAAEQELLKKVALVFGAATLALLIVLRVGLGAFEISKKHTLETLRQELAGQSGLGGLPNEDLERRAAELSEKARFFDTLVGRRIFCTEKMDELARLVPPEVRLTLFQYTDTENKDGQGEVALNFEGLVTGAEDGGELSMINRFLTALKSNEAFMRGFDEARIASVQRITVDGSPRTKFAIACSPPARKDGS